MSSALCIPRRRRPFSPLIRQRFSPTSPTQRSPTPLTCCTRHHIRHHIRHLRSHRQRVRSRTTWESHTQFSVTRWQHCAAPPPMWSTRTVIGLPVPNRLSKESAGTDCSSRYRSHRSRTPRTITASMRSPSSVESHAVRSPIYARASDYPTATGTPSLWPADSMTLFSLSAFTNRLDRIIRRQRT